MHTIGFENQDVFPAGATAPAQSAQDNTLGQILLRRRKLDPKDIDRILKYAEKKRLRFGSAALRLGLVSRQELDHAVAAQFDYPFLESGAEGYSARLCTAFDPFGRQGTAFRMLQQRLIQHWFDEGHRTLAVAGPSGQDGCSHVAANLAVAFSQQGRSTILVDGNLRRPGLHKFFNLNNDLGLSSVLVGRFPLTEVTLRLAALRRLSLVTAGIVPPNVGDLLWRPELERTIAELRERYQVVIFDTPSWRSDIGAENIARLCQGALLVVRRDHTRASDAIGLSEALTAGGTRILGSTLNRG
ncbi:MAG: chain length determinant protein tyrosine kinase EpsG [Gammaproteobacteria bacterium]|jgi:chain length determinant protein tyrosine kinase EpsG|nr:chain length determinant protein tyrosine kinase EpsG [Gammaproteobacteria bacterium]